MVVRQSLCACCQSNLSIVPCLLIESLLFSQGLLVAVALVYALCDGLIFLRRQYRMPHYLAFSWPRDVVSQHSS